jgi:hypothetical protein
MATTLKLYDIPIAFARIEAILDAAEGELTPELESELNALEMALEQKTDGICAMIREAEAAVEAYKAERDRLELRRKVAENRVERLKAYLKDNMERLGRDLVEGEHFRARIQSNTRPSFRWNGANENIPDGFRRVEIKLDGDACYQAWREDRLPDSIDCTKGTHLRIVNERR